MAVDVVDGTLHDPLGGQADLEARVLRTPLTPEESFSDDPLRMLRAARFLAGFDLAPAPGWSRLPGRCPGGCGSCPPNASAKSCGGSWSSRIPGVGLTFLEETGQLPMFLPEVSELSALERAEVFGRVVAAGPVPEVRLAALLMDVSAPVLEERLRWLRLSGGQRAMVLGLAAAVGLIRGRSDEAWSDEAVRRLTAVAGEVPGRGGRPAGLAGPATGVLEKRLADLRADGDLDDLGPALGGVQVIELLGLEPGPDVGEAMAWLAELRLSEGRLEPDEAGRRLVDWWEGR